MRAGPGAGGSQGAGSWSPGGARPGRGRGSAHPSRAPLRAVGGVHRPHFTDEDAEAGSAALAPAPPLDPGGVEGGTEMNQSPRCGQRGAGWAGQGELPGHGCFRGALGAGQCPPGRGGRRASIRGGVPGLSGLGWGLAETWAGRWQDQGCPSHLATGCRVPLTSTPVSCASNSPGGSVSAAPGPEAASGQPWAGGRRALVRPWGPDSSPLHPPPGPHGAVIPGALLTASLAPDGLGPLHPPPVSAGKAGAARPARLSPQSSMSLQLGRHLLQAALPPCPPWLPPNPVLTLLVGSLTHSIPQQSLG